MKRIELLDYARFYAAVFVVAFHYTFNGIANGKISSIDHIPGLIEITKFGYLGVELFFMISGYVIFFSAQNRTAASFATQRAIRLLPCYFFAVLFTSFFMYFWGGHIAEINFSQILINLTMLQSFVGVPHIDGVYWTLVYEISFYFGIFLILLVGAGRYLNNFFLIWPGIMLIAHFLELDHYPYLGGYYAYFSAGALFALYGGRRSIITLLALATATYLCFAFSMTQAKHMSIIKGVDFSEIVIGSILCAFFLFFFFLNSSYSKSLTLKGSKILGALTYPIYLVHAHVGYILVDRFANHDNMLFVYIATIFFVILISLLMHLIIEKKYSWFWRLVFTGVIEKPVSIISAWWSKNVY